MLTARKYYDVSFMLDGETQEPKDGSVEVKFYYSQSVAANAISKSEIEAQAEELISTEKEETTEKGVTITGNVLKIDGEEVLAVLGKNVSKDDLEIFKADGEAETEESEKEKASETKVTIAEDAKVQMYHFDGNELKAVSADIQTIDGNKLKEVSFSSDSFSVYAVAISNSAETEDVEVVETSKADISAEKLIDFINEQFGKGNSIALGQNLLIPGGNKRIEIPAGKRVVLYLNGFTIQPVGDSTRTDAVIAVGGNSSFTIKGKLENSSKVPAGEGNGSIQNFKGAPVIRTVGSKAELYIKDVEISNNENANGDGGVIEDAYSQNDTKIALSNATFQYNKANRGGVVRAASSRITVEGCTFTKNSANNEGGVFFLDGGSDVHGVVLTIKSGKFHQNTATKQGGVISGSQDTSVTVESGIFEENKAGRGGAIYLNNSEYKDATTSLVISGGEFVENEANSKGNDGGDMWNNYGGGAIFAAVDNIELSGTAKIDNNWTVAGGGGIRINRGTFIMQGGSVTNNIATGNEGGGISLHNATAVIVKGTISGNMTGYNKDRTPNADYADWGGGGIFCSQDATLLIRNAKITDNNAYGFGGGVAGCATGRVFLFETDGCAIYQNKNYADLGQSEPKLSGALSHKNYDRLYAATNEIFMEEGSSDFYCALNSSVSWKMRGVDAGWKGSVDGIAVNENMKANDADYLNASYLMGLTANPKGTFDNNFGVIITGNTSRTHGGGILNNGYLVAGKTVKISTGSRLEVNALKALLSDGNYDTLTEADRFDFSIVEVDSKDNLINGGFTSNGVNDTKGDITFDALIPFTEAGTFYYIVKENPGDRSDIKYTDTQYKIVVKTAEESNGTIPVLEESGITISEINKYQVKIKSVTVYKKQADGAWTDVTNNCTYSEASDDHASAIALGKYEGEGDKRHLVGGDQAAFINEKYNQDYVNIVIRKSWNDPDWLEKADHPTLTFKVYRYEESEKDKKLVDTVTLKNGEIELTIDGAGDEKYAKYYDLENYKSYTYVVEEDDVDGYKNTAVGVNDDNTEWTFTNEKTVADKVTLVLSKVSSKDEKKVLEGAEFDLYLMKEDGKELIGHGVTDENGQLSFTGLEAGKYQLIETKAPAGYRLSKDIYEVTLTKEQIGAAGVIAEKTQKKEGEIGVTVTNVPEDPKTPDKPSDPGTPNTPGTPNNPGNPTTIETPVIPLGSDVLGAERVPDVTITADVFGENRPQTGDDTNVWGLAVAALACVGVLGAYAWKRKKGC